MPRSADDRLRAVTWRSPCSSTPGWLPGRGTSTAAPAQGLDHLSLPGLDSTGSVAQPLFCAPASLPAEEKTPTGSLAPTQRVVGEGSRACMLSTEGTAKATARA